MATIRKEILIDAGPEAVWAAIRDIGAVHRRLTPGFVVDTRLDGDARIVTFANGLVARELIVDIDEQARRLAYAATGAGPRITMPRFRSLPRATAAAGWFGSPTCCRTILPGSLARWFSKAPTS
jgi:hypothetical protein